VANRYCKQCGKELQAGKRFCTGSGSAVLKPAAAPVPMPDAIGLRALDESVAVPANAPADVPNWRSPHLTLHSIKQGLQTSCDVGWEINP
jgi:hypothetical protein